MQELFRPIIPLSYAQQKRISQFCVSLLLAGNCQLSQMARWLKREGSQAHREQWLRRLLDAHFVSQELIYQPWFKQCLSGYKVDTWHLVMDRSHWIGKEEDIVMLGLAYRKRAIPLGWIQVPYGGASIQTYQTLIEQCKKLIPRNIRVIFHGDAEFGAMPMMKYIRQQGWDFILGQRIHYTYQAQTQSEWLKLSELALSKRHSIYLSNIVLTQEHHFEGVNLFGFVQAGKKGKDETRFYATSLPIAHTLRKVGRQRWSIECCFQDYKSSGLALHETKLLDPQARNRLLVLASVCYLWLTSLGRWLCKTGQRQLVDKHSPRQLSLYRIGWDWLVYQFRTQQAIPHRLTLYS